jgi:hypothetical protein
MTITTTNGRAAPPSPRLQEIQAALALHEGLVRRIAELEQADRDATMQLTLIRSLLAEYRDQLDRADRAAAQPKDQGTLPVT